VPLHSYVWSHSYSTRTEGDYVDLSDVPEHYTGYSGEKAHRVWRSIYEENCFGLTEYDVISGRSTAGLPDTMNEHLGEGDEQCLEKRVYYKVISGM
jgi:ERO1-like protein beta